MKKITIAASISLLLFAGAQSALGGFYDVLAPVVGDLVPSVVGVEHALPFIIDRDGTYIRFRVRNAVTGVLLHQTTQKAFDYPASCVDPEWSEDSPSASWLRAEGSSRVHFLQVLWRECREPGANDSQEADKAIIYSFDASSAAGVVWTYQVDRQPASFDLVDVDGDGDQDVMLTTMTLTGDTETWYVRAMDADTGVLISQKTYAVVQP